MNTQPVYDFTITILRFDGGKPGYDELQVMKEALMEMAVDVAVAQKEIMGKEWDSRAKRPAKKGKRTAKKEVANE